MYALLLPVLAVVAMAMSAAAAQAQPHWYSCEKVGEGKGKFENAVCTKEGGKKEFEWVRIKVGTKEKPFDVQVTTTGVLILHALGREIECKVNDKGSIWNPAGGGAGEDEITAFTTSGCKLKSGAAICTVATELEVVPVNLPWYSRLLAGPPIRDEVYAETTGKPEGIKVAIRCKGAEVDTPFTGILTPEIGVNVATFGAGSGELEDTAKNKATVTGNDSIEGPAGDEGITAKNP